MEQKIEALKCYEREGRLFPHPRSVEAVQNLAVRRGIEAGFRRAEAFMILHDEWR
jgi:hypothetical protein